MRRSLIAVAAHAYKTILASAATPHAASPHSPLLHSQRRQPRVEMPAAKYEDDQDEVGTGLYVLIGCAAVTVVLMYSWIGYTLYQGFKARRKVD